MFRYFPTNYVWNLSVSLAMRKLPQGAADARATA